MNTYVKRRNQKSFVIVCMCLASSFLFNAHISLQLDWPWPVMSQTHTQNVVCTDNYRNQTTLDSAIKIAIGAQ